MPSSVDDKVRAIFREIAGERASALEGDVPARHAKDLFCAALSEDYDPVVADEVAFHLVDWNADAAFLVAVLLFPERFTPDDLAAGASELLVHVPAHVMAAARLAGHPAVDIFKDDERTQTDAAADRDE